MLCNACGLFLKLHGRPRPISLKTDVIKSRNRVKGTGQGAKKRVSTFAKIGATVVDMPIAVWRRDWPSSFPSRCERASA